MAAIRIGITGGIGSGKSVVSRLLELMGVPVYISDIETRRLMVEDVQIRRELVSLLGEDVYQGGRLNKPLLASYIFGSAVHAARVNGIVHPRVKDDFRRWCRLHASDRWVGMESAILLEAGSVGKWMWWSWSVLPSKCASVGPWSAMLLRASR